MTYREMMQRDHPKSCGDRFIGGCQGCPGDYYPDAKAGDKRGCFYNPNGLEDKCKKCWDQECKKENKFRAIF